MNWEENLKLIAELKERKLVTDKTIYVANHFSHNGGLSYAEMAALSQKHEIITSYDGLEILTSSDYVPSFQHYYMLLTANYKVLIS